MSRFENYIYPEDRRAIATAHVSNSNKGDIKISVIDTEMDMYKNTESLLDLKGSMKDSPLDKQVGGNHYSSMKIQPIEFIVENEIPYREANAIKYICRHKNKNGAEDIKKAIHYLEMILAEYANAPADS